jgi:hypothetical protein
VHDFAQTLALFTIIREDLNKGLELG